MNIKKKKKGEKVGGMMPHRLVCHTYDLAQFGEGASGPTPKERKRKNFSQIRHQMEFGSLRVR